MTTTQDASIGFAIESTYKTGVTAARFIEFVDEDMDWQKNTVQGMGLRVGSRVARSARRVVPTAQGVGSFEVEATSKGLGLLWQLALGANTSTLVSGTTYQQVASLGDTPPSATVQKGVVEAGGTVDPITFLGCMVGQLDITGNNAGLCMAKFTLDIGDITTATGYAAPSYPTSPNLFHFANLQIYSGAFTAPTATALAIGATPLADVRDFAITMNRNLMGTRFNANGTGRKSKPTVGITQLSGKATVEYDATTWRDAVINETPMLLVATYTAGALSSGNETLQIVLPEIKFDTELPKTNGTDLITQSMAFQGLDNLSATQPIWIVTRTADSAL